jgi:hypothetical protein
MPSPVHGHLTASGLWSMSRRLFENVDHAGKLDEVLSKPNLVRLLCLKTLAYVLSIITRLDASYCLNCASYIDVITGRKRCLR